MSINPQISIVIPCYNHGEFILETLNSISKCDSNLYELVIVNDGSNDLKTLEIFQKLEKSGYRIIHQENGGQSKARNKGIMETKAPFVLPVDSDNLILPEMLTKCLSAFKESEEIDVVYSDSILFGEISGINTNLEFNYLRLLLDNYIDTCALIKRSALERVGYYDVEIQGIEDWDLWLKIAFSGGKFHYIKEPLFKYRYRSNSFIRKDAIFNKKMKIALQNKHFDKLNFEYIETNIYHKFSASPIQFVAKLFLRKFLPKLYKRLLSAGRIQKF